MAIDPALLETPAAAPAAPAEPAAPAAAPAPSASGAPAAGAAEAPPNQPDIDWARVFESPEYKSRKDKEIAAERTRWQRQESDRIASASAEAARQQAATAQMERARKAYLEGDLDAQAELSRDAYNQLIQQQTRASTIDALGKQYEAAIAKLTAGDEAAATRLDYRRWNDAQAWLDAVSDYRVEKEADTRAEALAEAKVASARATERNGKPNPDTAEMVGGHGGPVASLSIEELNARYCKAKDDGNSEEVVRLKPLLHRRTPVAAAGRR